MSKLLKSMRWVYQGLKSKRKENLTKHVGFVREYALPILCKENKKIQKVMMRKVATSRKRMVKNKTHFSFWVFDCGLQDALLILISLTGRNHDLLSLCILVSKFEGWRGRHFYGRPRVALGLATPLQYYIHPSSKKCNQ